MEVSWTVLHIALGCGPELDTLADSVRVLHDDLHSLAQTVIMANYLLPAPNSQKLPGYPQFRSNYSRTPLNFYHDVKIPALADIFIVASWEASRKTPQKATWTATSKATSDSTWETTWETPWEAGGLPKGYLRVSK